LARQKLIYPSIKSFTSSLEELGRVRLFGGSVRDVFLGEKHNSDLDFVVDCDPADLINFMPKEVVVNNFGGFKLLVANQAIDVWACSNTWAFKQGIIPYDPEKLITTTFFDWDMITYDTKTKKFNMSLDYINVIKSGIISINLLQNPSPVNVAIRALYWQEIKQIKLSQNLKKFMRETLMDIPVESLLQKCKAWGKIPSLTEEHFTKIK